jgi:hypothetical protein
MSRERPAPRAIASVARLTQAINSTVPTAANNRYNDGSTSRPSGRAIGRTSTPNPLFGSGYSRASRSASTAISISACATVAPGFSLATACRSTREPRGGGLSNVNGRHSWMSRNSMFVRGGMTPMTT